MYGRAEDWYLLAVLVAIQASIWGYLYWRGGLIRGPLLRWLEQPGQETKRENVKLNGHCVNGWTFWMVVTIHHTLAGLLALFGYLHPNRELSVWLVRLGVSFEIGENVLHMIQMAWTYFLPPGSEMFGELFTTTSYWSGIFCHHLIGLAGGSFVFIYVPDWPEAQFVIVLLLLAVVPTCIEYPFMPFTNMKSDQLSSLGTSVVVIMLISNLVAYFIRILAFPPVAWFLRQKLHTEFGSGVANALGFTAVVFVVFSFGSLALNWAGISQSLRLLTSHDKKA